MAKRYGDRSIKTLTDDEWEDLSDEEQDEYFDTMTDEEREELQAMARALIIHDVIPPGYEMRVSKDEALRRLAGKKLS